MCFLALLICFLFDKEDHDYSYVVINKYGNMGSRTIACWDNHHNVSKLHIERFDIHKHVSTMFKDELICPRCGRTSPLNRHAGSKGKRIITRCKYCGKKVRVLVGNGVNDE